MGKSAGAAPQPAKFKKIDIPDIEGQATQADIAGYNLSDADMASRFPGLVSGRQQQLDDSYKQLTGPLDPTVQNNFMHQGLAQSLGAFGGGDPGAQIGQTGHGPTASGNAVATSLANNVQKKQDYDRQNFEQNLANNPQRAFGLSGEDVANMSIANILGQNTSRQQAYLGRVGAANASTQAGNQQTQGIIGGIVSIVSAAAIAY